MSPWLRAASAALVLCCGAPLASAQEAPSDPSEEEQVAEEQPDDTTPAGLVEARAAIGEAQFGPALEALDRALQEGGAQPEHLQEIYHLQGETLVAVGKSEEGRAAFKILLVLNADATLGEFASPKIVAELDEARNELAGASLEARHHFDLQSRRLDVFVDSDPLAMTAKVRLTYPRQDASSAELSIPLESGKAIFDVPGQAGAGVELALLDRNSNVLFLWQVEDLPVVVGVQITDPKTGQITSVGSTGESIWSKWWVYAGAGAAFATVGSVFGIASSMAQSDLDDVIADPGNHFLSDAKALEDKAQSRANWANLSFAMAGAFGIASGVMYWRAQKSESTLQVAPATDGSSASLTLGGRF